MKEIKRAGGLICEFNSPQELALHYKQLKGGRLSTSVNRWQGNQSPQQCFNCTMQGDSSLVPEAEKLMAQYCLTMPTVQHSRVRSVVGGVPLVAAALQGHPLAMRRRVKEQVETAPIRIYMSLTSSAGISADMLRQRGVAVLALVMHLCESRAVDLYAYGELHCNGAQGIYTLLPIETRPLDLAMACNTLTNVTLDREIIHYFSKEYGFNGGWPKDYHASNYNELVRARFDLSPQDVLIPSAHIDQFRNPEQWITETLAKIEAWHNQE